ncbi:hypothetical protein Lal_00019193 [Lupinus albus]|uniref:Putative F-box domain-containing protein n=1 Tax=Lupinus albus TaxID=3870 RepID=A0A6A5PQ49_LUPAL|nr:putative F-box domain-containing protein [Lupinus albus]KAF1899072.1 hypothetical protein Lal_00019193 [Lupinus albus]
MSEVKNKFDFIQWLGPDMSIKILTHLDDPCDLAHVSSVSSSWHQFVIENGLCKKLCLKMFPEISAVAHIIEVDNMIEPVSNSPGSFTNWECLKRNHKVYGFIAAGFTPSNVSCISEAVIASSTDNYPEESIRNTLEHRDRTDFRASYWSSKGESDPSVPETLVYRLNSKLCLVTEIHIQPFQAYFQHGLPLYSSKSVRFRMGHSRYPMELESAIDYLVGDQFIWTYTSPEFPMLQENRLQKFKLPEPVLCIGGVVLVELLGRVQKQEMDELFYICISHVQVVGRTLTPAFDVKLHHPSGKCALNYCPQIDSCMSSTTSSSSRRDSSNPSRLRTLNSNIMLRGVRRWERFILGAFLGSGNAEVDDQ